MSKSGFEPTLKNSEAKRKRNDSNDEIEPISEKKPRKTKDEAQSDPETEDEADSKTEKTGPGSESGSEPNSDHEHGTDSKTEFDRDEDDSRLTLCLKCGTHLSGSHANVSYCFSEHMCNEEAHDRKQQFLDCIYTIANAMYYNEVSSDVRAEQRSRIPFNVFDIGRTLQDLFLQYQNSRNSE